MVATRRLCYPLAIPKWCAAQWQWGLLPRIANWLVPVYQIRVSAQHCPHHQLVPQTHVRRRLCWVPSKRGRKGQWRKKTKYLLMARKIKEGNRPSRVINRPLTLAPRICWVIDLFAKYIEALSSLWPVIGPLLWLSWTSLGTRTLMLFIPWDNMLDKWCDISLS